jgi:hypothetical protein
VRLIRADPRTLTDTERMLRPGAELELFSIRSGIPLADLRRMDPGDTRLLIRTWVRAQELAEMDRVLTAEIPDRPPPDRYTWESATLAYVLGSLTALTLLLFCGFLGSVLL